MTYERAPIRSIAKLQSGFAFKSQDWQDKGVPVIRIKNVKAGRLEMDGCAYVSEAVAQATASFRLSLGDILLSMTGEVGERAIVRSSDWMMLNQRVGRFTFLPDSENRVDRAFFYHALAHPEVVGDLKNRAYGVAQPNISGESVGAVEVYLPPLPTQQRIAAILSAYDDLIENNTRRIEILEEMVRRLYEEWFVHFHFPGHDEAEFEVVGQHRLPTGWAFVSLDTLFSTSAGGTPSRKRPEYFGGPVRWVKSKELLDGPIFDTEETITEEGLKRSSAKVFPRNSILVAMYGANIGQLGVLQAEAATNQAVCGVMPADGECGWCYAFLTLLQRRSELVDLRAGAAQQNISQAIIRKFPILRADTETHRRFEEAVEPLLTHWFVLHRKNANLRAQRDMVLPKLISGEIDVTYTLEAAKEAAE